MTMKSINWNYSCLFFKPKGDCKKKCFNLKVKHPSNQETIFCMQTSWTGMFTGIYFFSMDAMFPTISNLYAGLTG